MECTCIRVDGVGEGEGRRELVLLPVGPRVPGGAHGQPGQGLIRFELKKFKLIKKGLKQ